VPGISSERRLLQLTPGPNRIHWVFLLAIAASFFCGAATAQQGAVSAPAQSAAPASSDAPKQDPPAKPEPPKDQKPAAAADAKPMTPEEARQAQIVADTNKLFELAQELQAEVAKSSKNTLSLAVVKKAAEVEKLAKSLKERMKPE